MNKNKIFIKNVGYLMKFLLEEMEVLQKKNYGWKLQDKYKFQKIKFY